MTTVIVIVVLLGMAGVTEDEPASEAAAASADDGGSAALPDPQDTSEPVKGPDEEKPAAEPKVSVTESAQTPEPERQPTKKAALYSVLAVVDGDTVKVAYRGGVSVRVIGIDTPETVHPSVAEECWGQAASDAADKMLTGKKVRLVFDPTQGRTDAYDRTLAYLEVPGIGDFGLAMLRRGHAAEYTYDTAYQRQIRYRSAAADAAAAGRAMWDRCGGPDEPLQKLVPRPFVGGGGSSCEPGYDPCVPSYPPDVDCGDVDGPIAVSGADSHGLDGEGDGIACE